MGGSNQKSDSQFIPYSDYHKWDGSSSRGFMPKCVKSLSNDTEVYDDVVASFVHLFNSHEFDKVRLNGEYECAIMFNGFALENLCFLKTTHSDGRHSARRCSYQFEEMNRNVTLKRKSTKRGERVKAGMNIFLNVKRLILPYNVPGYHWLDVLLCRPKYFAATIFDSLHGTLDDYRDLHHVSQCIHRWIKEHHALRMGFRHKMDDMQWS
jgi:hypothetical protein